MSTPPPRTVFPVAPPEQIDAGPVLLRPPSMDDYAAIFDAISMSQDHLRPWMPWAANPPSELSVRAFVATTLENWSERTDFGYAIVEPGGAYVGGTGLHGRLGPSAMEIGYWVRSDRTGRGYVTAAARALTRAAFAIPGIERVEIHCDETNLRSAAVPERLGFTRAGVVDSPVRAPAETGRQVHFVMLRSDADRLR